jgi:hypothetical protein
MKLQILQDNTGKDTGVYVPIADWELIKRDYPDIELVENEIPQWEKDIIGTRLEAIEEFPHKVLQSGDDFIAELRRKL